MANQSSNVRNHPLGLPPNQPRPAGAPDISLPRPVAVNGDIVPRGDKS